MLVLREDEPAQSIAVSYRTPRDDGGGLRGPHCLKDATSRKVHGPAKIQPDDDRPIALISEHLGMGLTRPSGYSPIHGSQIVARLIQTRFIVLYAASSEWR